MKQYLEILEHVNTNGTLKLDRTGYGTKSSFSVKFRHNMADGFPLLTTKRVGLAASVAEMFAFFRGETNIEAFHELGCKFWDKWAMPKTVDRLESIDDVNVLLESLATLKHITIHEAHVMYQTYLDSVTKWHDDLMEATQEASDKALADAEEAEYSDQLLLARSTETILADWHDANPKPPAEATWWEEQGLSRFQRRVLAREGDLGPIYGAQWVKWKTSTGDEINQLKNLVENLRKNPYGRRHIISGWNPEVVADEKNIVDLFDVRISDTAHRAHDNVTRGKQALPPCHLMTIIHTEPDHENDGTFLNMHLTMRSTDVPIGLPYNIAGYAVFLLILAKQTGLKPGQLVIEMVDCHIYGNQFDLVPTQLERTPTELPTITIPDGIDLTDPSTLTSAKLKELVESLEGYNPQAHIPYPVNV